MLRQTAPGSVPGRTSPAWVPVSPPVGGRAGRPVRSSQTPLPPSLEFLFPEPVHTGPLVCPLGGPCARAPNCLAASPRPAVRAHGPASPPPQRTQGFWLTNHGVPCKRFSCLLESLCLLTVSFQRRPDPSWPAASAAPLSRPWPPWLQPLPSGLAGRALLPTQLGALSCPDEQKQII
ncbi:hypothetical protein HJG60_008097 [Phyllostomus discolor]|uniref:Uncharacterized protein n=1 Tax=Phyllostomus discolor TaxID=89673 RepID=A0A834BJ27_9CHIR|nr:hypothetical protein HJG60_008097 [Phyllostomus discolor]